MSYIFIDTQKEFDELAVKLAKHKYIAIDTESNSLYAYKEKFCLMQLTGDHINAVVDTLAVDIKSILPVFADPAVEKIISEYTRESGVRQLEREIGKVCRKVARKIAEGKKDPTRVTRANLHLFLGPPKFLPEAEQEMCKSGVNMANAIASKDASKCQTLADETQKNSCMMNVQTEKAVAAESEEECNVLEPAFAETCRQVFYMRMAALKSDTAYCDKVQGEGAKGVCKSGLASAVVPETNALAEETEPGNKILMLFGSIILAIILAAAVIFIALRKRKKSSGFPPLILQQQERRE